MVYLIRSLGTALRDAVSIASSAVLKCMRVHFTLHFRNQIETEFCELLYFKSACFSGKLDQKYGNLSEQFQRKGARGEQMEKI